MLKVPSVLSDTPTQSLPPLVDSSVNYVLVKSALFCNQSFFQMVDVTDPATVDSLLQNAPDRVVNRIEVRAVRWPVLWTDEVRSRVSQLKAVQLSRSWLRATARAVRRRPLPDLRSADPVVSVWCNRRFTEASEKFLTGNSVIILLAPYPFSL